MPDLTRALPVSALMLATLLILGRVAAAQEATPISAARGFVLPGEGVRPGGIAYDEATGDVFVGDTGDGTIYRGDAETGAVGVFSPAGADGRTAAAGMAADGLGRLHVAGGSSGRGFVYNIAGGALVGGTGDAGRASPPGNQGFVSDVVVLPNGDAYYVDAAVPVLREMSADFGRHGFHWLSGPIVDRGGTTLTGIETTLDGRSLLVIQADTGALYRIERPTLEAIRVDLGAASLAGADDLLLDNRTLYVVRGGAIAVLRLREDYAEGRPVGVYADPAFPSPAAVARVGRCLLVANAEPPSVVLVSIPDWAVAADDPAAATSFASAS